jgi:hypothetical protein
MEPMGRDNRENRYPPATRERAVRMASLAADGYFAADQTSFWGAKIG